MAVANQHYYAYFGNIINKIYAIAHIEVSSSNCAGYYDQQLEQLNDNDSLLDALRHFFTFNR